MICDLGKSSCTPEGCPGRQKGMGYSQLFYSSPSVGRPLRPLEVRVSTGDFTKMNGCYVSERRLYFQAVPRCTTSSIGQSKPKPCHWVSTAKRSHNATCALLRTRISEVVYCNLLLDNKIEGVQQDPGCPCKEKSGYLPTLKFLAPSSLFAHYLSLLSPSLSPLLLVKRQCYEENPYSYAL